MIKYLNKLILNIKLKIINYKYLKKYKKTDIFYIK